MWHSSPCFPLCGFSSKFTRSLYEAAQSGFDFARRFNATRKLVRSITKPISEFRGGDFLLLGRLIEPRRIAAVSRSIRPPLDFDRHLLWYIASNVGDGCATRLGVGTFGDSIAGVARRTELVTIDSYKMPIGSEGSAAAKPSQSITA